MSSPHDVTGSPPLDDRTLSLLTRLAARYGVSDGPRISAAGALLSAKLHASPSLQDGGVLMRALIQRLISDSRKAEATRFAQVAAALTFEPGLVPDGGETARSHTSWAIMYLLSSLWDSEAAEASASSAPGSVGHHRRGFEPPDDHRARSDVNSSDYAFDDSEEDDDADYFDADGNPTSESLRAASRHRRGANSSGSLAVLEPRIRGSASTEKAGGGREGRVREPGKAAAVTPRDGEVLLVRDVMLVVQGENGAYVRFPCNEKEQVEGVEAGESEELSAESRRKATVKDMNEVVTVRPLPRNSVGTAAAVRSEEGDFIPVSPSTLHLVRYIAELGFLFKVIYRRLRSVNDRPGLVATNFCTAVEREMESYYRSLATFATGVDVPDEELPSLRTVYVWAEAEKPRLRWLARLCEETSGLHGGQILAHLRSYHKSYVSSDVRGVLSRIIAHTAAPLDLMLIRWVTEGVLVDPHHEFYIMEDPKVAAAAASAAAAVNGLEGSSPHSSVTRLIAGGPNAASTASHRIWWGLFKVRRDMIPGVQSRSVVESTLVAGKSIAFLRRCCGDAGWVDQTHAPEMSAFLSGRNEHADSGAGFRANHRGAGRGDVSNTVDCELDVGMGLLDQDPRFSGADRVGELVRRAVRSASARLKMLFFEKFDLSHHFAAIKNYLLLAQGDFTQALMDSLAPLLDGDGRILRNNITGLLDSALRGSSGFNPSTDGDIAERLDVQIVAVGGKDSVGWDVFSLTYRVEDAPLNTVFSAKVMDAYLRIFRFLWRLKRLDHVLSQGYIELRELDFVWQRRRRWRASDDNREVDEGGFEAAAEAEVSELLKRANFLRVQMAHVLGNIQYYCTFEVLEGNWQVLLDEMSRAQDIDSLIDAHARYLATIKDRTLLSERTQDVARSLDAVLESMLAFRKAQQQFCRWGMAVRGDTSLVGSEHIAAFKSELGRVEASFRNLFAQFLSELANHKRIVQSIMFLLFRLDYNGYFASLAIQGISANPGDGEGSGKDNDSLGGGSGDVSGVESVDRNADVDRSDGPGEDDELGGDHAICGGGSGDDAGVEAEAAPSTIAEEDHVPLDASEDDAHAIS